MNLFITFGGNAYRLFIQSCRTKDIEAPKALDVQLGANFVLAAMLHGGKKDSKSLGRTSISLGLSLGTVPIEDVGDHGLPLLSVSGCCQQFCRREILLRNFSIHPFG